MHWPKRSTVFFPSEKAKAAGAPVEIDISKIEPGQLITVEWQGKPIWVLDRTEAQQNKTKVIRHQWPWRGMADVELATLEWVDWFNHHRLLEQIGYVPPVEYEMAYYRQLEESAKTA